MNGKRHSRRVVLKQLASMSVLGALGYLRSAPARAAQPDMASNASIAGLRGRLIHRQDADYENWRKAMVWHRSKPSRYPDLIVQALSEADVIAAVRYAARKRLRIAIRSGGHNSTGPSLRQGGMCLDVSALNQIRIDTTTRIAAIQPGVRSQSLITAAGDVDLSFPVPHCPSVGLSGFVLGGGIGWNYAHRGGIATFSIAAAEIVLADGTKVLANADQYQDLLWAVRGAGPGFFGVVTRLYLELYPAPRAIVVNSYILPLEKLEMVTKSLDSLMRIKDERVEVLALMLHNPAASADAVAEDSKICFVSCFAFADTDAAARDMLSPFARSALAKHSLTRVEDQDFTYQGLYNRFFSTNEPAGRMARYAVDNIMTNDTGETLLALSGHLRHAPSRDSHVLAAYGMNLRPRTDACFSSIANSYVGCYAIWDQEEHDRRNFDWLARAAPMMNPFARGRYVNEVEARLYPEHIPQSFSAENWQRLQHLRQEYDPHGVFHNYLGQG